MSAFWRAAGLTYVNYSSIAAKVTRQALKAGPAKVSRHPWFHHDIHLLVRLFVTKSQPSTISFHWLVLKSQEAATKREITSVKFQKWDSGKPVGAKFWAWNSEAFSLGCSLGERICFNVQEHLPALANIVWGLVLVNVHSKSSPITCIFGFNHCISLHLNDFRCEDGWLQPLLSW